MRYGRAGGGISDQTFRGCCVTHGAEDGPARRPGAAGSPVGRAAVGRAAVGPPTPGLPTPGPLASGPLAPGPPTPGPPTPGPPASGAARPASGQPHGEEAPPVVVGPANRPGAHPAARNLVSVTDGSGSSGGPGVLGGVDRPSRLAEIMATEPPAGRTVRDRLRTRTGRWALAVGALVVLGAAGTTVVTLRAQDRRADTSPPPRIVAPAGPSTSPSPVPAVVPADTGPTVTLAATGDVIMGAAPDGLPPNGGRTFFAGVRDALRADVTMGNLEQPLTDDTGVSKCPPPASPSPGASPSPSPLPSPSPPRRTCFAFRSPPGYASLLHEAGYRVMNLANNHAYDFGPAGNRQTRAALDKAGLAHTGAPGEITVVDVNGIKVAVLGFAPYPWAQSLTDLAAAADLVRRAHRQADLVVVQMHVGAEGADRTHVKPGVETYLGENRGDPIGFAHAVVDAGADLVVGHGPHVLRAMEFYKGHLIAYSMGNFAGYRALGYTGVVGLGGILKVTLRRDGSYGGGSLVPTKMVAPGLPGLDPARAAVPLVRGLSDTDLPDSGARIGDDGSITPRP